MKYSKVIEGVLGTMDYSRIRGIVAMVTTTTFPMATALSLGVILIPEVVAIEAKAILIPFMMLK